MRRLVIISLLLISLIALNSRELSLEQAIEVALENNIRLKSEEENVKSASWGVVSAFSALLPSGTISSGRNYSFPGRDFWQEDSTFVSNDFDDSYTLTLRKTIFSGGSRIYGYLNQKDSHEIAENKLNELTLNTISDTENRYFNLLEYRELMEIKKAELSNAAENLMKAEYQRDIGTISAMDFLQISSLKAAKEVEFIQAENLYKISKHSFALYLQITDEFRVAQIDSNNAEYFYQLIVPNPDKTLNRLNQYLKSNNVELLNSELNQYIAIRNYRSSFGNFLPNINFNYSHNWRKSDYQNNFNDSGTLSIQASMPIFPISDNLANLAISRHQMKQAELSKQNTEDEIKTDAEEIFYRFLANLTLLRSNKIAHEISKQTYQQVLENYQNGTTTYLDFKDAELMKSTSEIRYNSIIFDLLKNERELMNLLVIDRKHLRRIFRST